MELPDALVVGKAVECSQSLEDFVGPYIIYFRYQHWHNEEKMFLY